MILIIDFGSQYTQLIAKNVRQLNFYCIIQPFNNFTIQDNINGVILSGSPCSVNDENFPNIDFDKINVPILGICYGAQLIAHQNKCIIQSSQCKEYGSHKLNNVIITNDLIKSDYNDNMVFWMSHGDSIINISENIEPIIYSESNILSAFKVKNKEHYGIQFHAEVTQTTYGKNIFTNFIEGICGEKQEWKIHNIYTNIENNIKTIVNDPKHIDKKIIMAVSGGIDSTISAYIINKIVPDRLKCVFVDNGLLRKNEVKEVIQNYHNIGINIDVLYKKDLFINTLKEIIDPEKKRKLIGKLFIDSFVEYCHNSNLDSNNCLLGQGTIYPDIIESAHIKGAGLNIKSHHNVGGLPEKLNFTLLEPIKYLFKDDVRKLAYHFQLPDFFAKRHHFPGPGLAIRIMGDITSEKIEILQEADKIYIDYLKQHNLYNQIWQAGCILLSTKSVGVMGDERTYQYVLALRAVNSIDGMTAQCYHFEIKDLINISNKIINNVNGINRVVYDVSSKPPSTIEWE